MKYMSVFFCILFYKVAAGLCIYFIVSSLWGLAERQLLPKAKAALPPPTPAAAAVRPRTRGPKGSQTNGTFKKVHVLGWNPLRKLALRKAEAWMVERMGEGSDGLAAVFPAMLNSIIATSGA